MYTAYRSNSTNEEIITLYEALELIKKLVVIEKENEIFCSEISQNTMLPEDIKILTEMSLNHRKHIEILIDVYAKFTGTILPHTISFPNWHLNLSYLEQLEGALFKKIDLIKHYRRILGAMPDKESHTLIVSILTDKITNSDIYNFLISNQKL